MIAFLLIFLVLQYFFIFLCALMFTIILVLRHVWCVVPQPLYASNYKPKKGKKKAKVVEEDLDLEITP